ncbi:hypothetical protein NIASO_05625 [Niabella soli DSM 19437]|uniref:Uncharacterized protein n=1 Tax=Niabella soli DSM 19437 TaxID=929713 RepID=W0F780_9BACT|nr:hypothetical protein NIASO_05625 [Niabella soli DSM 19437]
MLFLKYFFYRVHNFVNKRRSNKDPEDYAFYVTAIFLALNFVGIFMCIANIMNFKKFTISPMLRVGLFLLLIIIYILIYRRVILNGKYKQFCKNAYYESSILNNLSIGNFFCIAFMITPLALYIIATLTFHRL